MNVEIRPFRVAILRGPASPVEPHPGSDPSSAGPPPAVDIHEGPEGMVLEADLPGLAEDAVTIHLEDNVLTLQSSAAPTPPTGTRPLVEEFRPGPFRRSFILSGEVDRDRIAAELKQGVLRITLPRVNQARPRRIEIKTG